MSWNCDTEVDHALEKLGQDFPHLNWDFSPDPSSEVSTVILSTQQLQRHWAISFRHRQSSNRLMKSHTL